MFSLLLTRSFEKAAQILCPYKPNDNNNNNNNNNDDDDDDDDDDNIFSYRGKLRADFSKLKNAKKCVV